MKQWNQFENKKLSETVLLEEIKYFLIKFSTPWASCTDLNPCAMHQHKQKYHTEFHDDALQLKTKLKWLQENKIQSKRNFWTKIVFKIKIKIKKFELKLCESNESTLFSKNTDWCTQIIFGHSLNCYQSYVQFFRHLLWIYSMFHFGNRPFIVKFLRNFQRSTW